MTSGHARIKLLGRLAIERDGVPGPGAVLAGRRSELVFAYLAVEHRRSVSRDELATALWPDVLPDTWNAALRGVISDVRRFLEGAGLDAARTLLSEQGGLRLQLPEDAILDYDEVRAALSRARELLAAGDPAAAAMAAAAAADAAALPFLTSHDGAWASGVRSELDELHIGALEVQARALGAAGDPRGALLAADRLVRADPYLESAHRLRIVMYGEAGDPAGAMKAFERCKALLASELGIAPSPDTEATLRAALERAPVEASPAAPPAAAPAAEPFAAYSVLVVEDHDFQRRTALTLLGGLGVGELHEASDGSAALALLEGVAAPDVIVCDIDMPGMDGIEFIRNVAARQLASAVVIASGLDERLLETVRAITAGYGLQVLGVIGKPLTAAALQELLTGYRPRPRTTSAGDAPAELASIAAALADGSLGAVFHPVIDLAVGRVAGVRAAAALGAPDPAVLDAAIDEAGLGRELAEHLLRAAAGATFGLGLDVFLTLPPGLLTDVELADGLAAILRDRVVLVVTSGALSANDGPAMLDVLARLRVKGFGVCIDGFDGGALERFPLTHAQLPAPLIAAAAAAGDAAALRPAVDASRALGIPVTGHCATAPEFDVLLQLGCSSAYGAYLAAPVGSDELTALVRGWTEPPISTARTP